MMIRSNAASRVKFSLRHSLYGLLLFALPVAVYASDVQLIPEATKYETGGQPVAVAVADLNKDGIADVITVNYAADSVSVLLGKSDGTYQPRVSYGVGSGPLDVQIADLDGDGNLDIAVVDATDSTVSILYGKGNGTFGSAKTLDVGGVDPLKLQIADLDGDGKLDIVTVNNTSNSISILLGSGSRTFKTATQI
ncbi:MAG: FG-GAP repeat domain-containing protein, partial [Gammaproteobacteria bacterium]